MNKKKVLFPVFLFVALSAVYGLARYAFPALYTPEWSARNCFFLAALIIFVPSVFDKHRFSTAALVGYIAGIAAGELFGGFRADEPPQFLHYGWIISIAVFALFCILGALLQRRKKN